MTWKVILRGGTRSGLQLKSDIEQRRIKVAVVRDGKITADVYEFRGEMMGNAAIYEYRGNDL